MPQGNVDFLGPTFSRRVCRSSATRVLQISDDETLLYIISIHVIFDWKVDCRVAIADYIEYRIRDETHSVAGLQAEPLLETKLTAPSRVTDAMTMLVGDVPLCWSRCWLLLPLALCADDGGGRSWEAVGALVNILLLLAHVRLYTMMMQQFRWTMIRVGAIFYTFK